LLLITDNETQEKNPRRHQLRRGEVSIKGEVTFDGDVMTFRHRSGQVKSVFGYPVREILRSSREIEVQWRRR
jgi:hypothetical protein